MAMWFEMMKRVVRNQKGQGMAEYGLIMALVAVVAIGAFTLLGTNITAKITSVANGLNQ